MHAASLDVLRVRHLAHPRLLRPCCRWVRSHACCHARNAAVCVSMDERNTRCVLLCRWATPSANGCCACAPTAGAASKTEVKYCFHCQLLCQRSKSRCPPPLRHPQLRPVLSPPLRPTPACVVLHGLTRRRRCRCRRRALTTLATPNPPPLSAASLWPAAALLAMTVLARRC